MIKFVKKNATLIASTEISQLRVEIEFSALQNVYISQKKNNYFERQNPIRERESALLFPTERVKVTSKLALYTVQKEKEK